MVWIVQRPVQEDRLSWGRLLDPANLSDREAIELCLLIGHYQGLASAIGGLGIQVEERPRERS